MSKLLTLILLVFILSGCARNKALKGGGSIVNTPTANASFTQPENPAQSAKQDFTTTTKTETQLPAGTHVEEVYTTTDEKTKVPTTTKKSYTLPEPAVTKTEIVTEVKSTVGAAQKDTAREIAAKIGAMRPVTILGSILVLCALAMFHPWVFAITRSRTLQMAVGAAGFALIFLPMVIVGHEILLICLGIAIPSIWFFVHRHGRLQGLVDANKDGVDDRVADLLLQMGQAISENTIADLIKKGSKYPGGKVALTKAAETRREQLKS